MPKTDYPRSNCYTPSPLGDLASSDGDVDVSSFLMKVHFPVLETVMHWRMRYACDIANLRGQLLHTSKAYHG